MSTSIVEQSFPGRIHRSVPCFALLAVSLATASCGGLDVDDPSVRTATSALLQSMVVYVDAATGYDQYDGTSLTYQGGTVGPKKTILAGLAATADGGNCYVAPGTYSEPTIFLSKAVSLIGAGPDKTIIQAMSSSQGVMRITANQTTVSNFTIKGGYYAIIVAGSSPYISNNIFTENSVGIHVIYSGSIPRIINNTIHGNSLAGLRLYSETAAIAMNNIVTSNGSYGVYCASSSTGVLAYNDAWGNTTDYHSNCPGAVSSMSADPEFVSASDLHLATGSPCIDAGYPSSTFNDLGGTRNDMGAYGGPGAYLPKEWYFYPKLIDNAKIAQAIQLTAAQRTTLMANIKQLEFATTAGWEALHDPSVVNLTLDQIKLVWLRRLAMSFFLEVNDVFAWKIVNYTQQHLDVLLGFHISQYAAFPPVLQSDINTGFVPNGYGSVEYVFDALVWAANPVRQMNIMKIIKQQYNPQQPIYAAYAVLEYARFLGWWHFDTATLPSTNNTDWESLPHHHQGTGENALWNFEAYWEGQGTSCHMAAALLRETMRAFNIPAVRGANVYGHHAVWMPSLGILLVDGDEFHRYPLKLFPAKHTFRTQTWYANHVGLSDCEFFFEHRRKTFLDWFSYYLDPVYGPALQSEFCGGGTDSSLYNPILSTCSQILANDPQISQWIMTLHSAFGC